MSVTKVDNLTTTVVADLVARWRKSGNCGQTPKKLEIQDKYGTRYINYWLDETAGKIFCLGDAPDTESAHASIERRTVWSLISSNRWSRAPWSSGTHLWERRTASSSRRFDPNGPLHRRFEPNRPT